MGRLLFPGTGHPMGQIDLLLLEGTFCWEHAKRTCGIGRFVSGIRKSR